MKALMLLYRDGDASSTNGRSIFSLSEGLDEKQILDKQLMAEIQ